MENNKCRECSKKKYSIKTKNGCDYIICTDKNIKGILRAIKYTKYIIMKLKYDPLMHICIKGEKEVAIKTSEISSIRELWK